MKKTILTGVLAIAACSIATAQSMKHTLKIGALGGFSVPNTNAVVNAGVNVAYQNMVTRNLGIGISSGYSYFFGKEHEVDTATILNNDFSLVPVAAMIHYYPRATGIYVGTDLGYGFVLGDDNVASNFNVSRPSGGFYIKPEVGWHNRHWNIFAHYTKVFKGDEGTIDVRSETQQFNIGTIGVGFAYNIGLGG